MNLKTQRKNLNKGIYSIYNLYLMCIYIYFINFFFIFHIYSACCYVLENNNIIEFYENKKHDLKKISSTPMIQTNINYKGILLEMLQKYYLNLFSYGKHIIIQSIQNSQGLFQSTVELCEYKELDNIFIGDFCVNKKESEQSACGKVVSNKDVLCFYSIKQDKSLDESSDKSLSHISFNPTVNYKGELLQILGRFSKNHHIEFETNQVSPSNLHQSQFVTTILLGDYTVDWYLFNISL